jgi:hypothetical protein
MTPELAWIFAVFRPSCKGGAARCAEFWIFRQQVFDAIEDVQDDALCGGRIMFIDVSAQG